MPFWASIGLLSVAQGAVVALPAPLKVPGAVRRLHSPLWGLIPAGSVIGFVLVAQLAERGSAHVLTYLALAGVPLLAALALGWLAHGSRPLAGTLAVGLFALAWADRGGLGGEAAGVALSGLSCAALGALIGALTPARWLGAGILAMALADTTLVVADQLQRPNSVLNAAHPGAGLPRLQVAILGSASMGYGDLFVAGVLGGLLAFRCGRSQQLVGAALMSALALVFDSLFFVVDELPATVPVAGALIMLVLARRRPVWSRLRLWRPHAARASLPDAAPPLRAQRPPGR
jgi:hypothetical protein